MVADQSAGDGSTSQQLSGVYLYWIPLGAGGAGLVRINGRIYEWVTARREKRKPLDLYHTALEVYLPEGRYVIENAWPSPDRNIETRGVVLEGPVFSRRISRFRVFRYEVRCWRDGVIPDANESVDSPMLVTDDPVLSAGMLQMVAKVPALVWGRDESRTGEMWNSNSVISWLLVSAGQSLGDIHPPHGGRVPGWEAGVVKAGGQTRL